MCESDMIEELKELIDGLSERLDDLCDSIEDTVERAVQETVEDAVSDALDDAMSNMSAEGAGAVMYIISQDGKCLMPFGSAQAFRKKGEETYCISVSYGNNGQTVGTYENKAAALAEIKNIAAALRAREDIYEIK